MTPDCIIILLIMSNFKKKSSFEDRLKESTNIKEKYADRIPIIVERMKDNVPEIDKHKFLVPNDLTVGQFLYVIRKRIQLNRDQALFIYINNILPTTSDSILHIYDKYVDADGFLYVQYSGENTFGCDFI